LWFHCKSSILPLTAFENRSGLATGNCSGTLHAAPHLNFTFSLINVQAMFAAVRRVVGNVSGNLNLPGYRQLSRKRASTDVVVIAKHCDVAVKSS